jgi:hypothetical protein
MKILIRVLTITLSIMIVSNQAASSEEDLITVRFPDVKITDNYRTAFSRLQRLEGAWDEAEYGRVIQYRLTGKGSALIEEFIGDPPMSSVYHLDGEDLRLTHYCNAGNQPRMIAAFYRDDTLKFEFVDVTNLSAPNAYHTRALDIEFQDDDHIVLKFVGQKDGKEIATTHTLIRRHVPLAD